MNKKTIALIGLTLVLTACKPPANGNTQQQAVAPKAKQIQEKQVTRGSIVGDYMAYERGVVGNGEKSVLFFHASWCPNCKEKDANLRTWYGEAEFPVKTYKVDYDTEDALKKKYGVTMQDTFVLIDGDGEVITTLVAPSLSSLKRLLYLNIGEAEAMEDEQMDEPMEDAAVMLSGEFTAYTEGVIGNGESSVLFFAAAWCPKCQANKKKLSAWYEGEDIARSVYEIDYDTATELKSRFGVIQQDTFILIDGTGKEIKRVSFPSEAELRGLVFG